MSPSAAVPSDRLSLDGGESRRWHARSPGDSRSQAFGLREERLSEDEAGGASGDSFIADDDEEVEEEESSEEESSGGAGRRGKKRRKQKRARAAKRGRGSSDEEAAEVEELAAADCGREGSGAEEETAAGVDAGLEEDLDDTGGGGAAAGSPRKARPPTACRDSQRCRRRLLQPLPHLMRIGLDAAAQEHWRFSEQRSKRIPCSFRLVASQVVRSRVLDSDEDQGPALPRASAAGRRRDAANGGRGGGAASDSDDDAAAPAAGARGGGRGRPDGTPPVNKRLRRLRQGESPDPGAVGKGSQGTPGEAAPGSAPNSGLRERPVRCGPFCVLCAAACGPQLLSPSEPLMLLTRSSHPSSLQTRQRGRTSALASAFEALDRARGALRRPPPALPPALRLALGPASHSVAFTCQPAHKPLPFTRCRL